MKKKLIEKIESLSDLQIKATTDPRYAQLVLLAASNLGMPNGSRGAAPMSDDAAEWKNSAAVMKAFRWLQTNALETSSAGVVKEVNFVRDLVTVEATAPATGKRGYSKAFTPANKATQARYLLADIPGDLWRKVSDKCKRDGVSRRAVILHLLEDWSGRS